jgi:hypothetical protein
MTSPFSAASMQSLIDVLLSDEQRLCHPRTEIRGVLFLSEFNLYCSRREITERSWCRAEGSNRYGGVYIKRHTSCVQSNAEYLDRLLWRARDGLANKN